MTFAPSLFHQIHGQFHGTVFGEFESVRQQVLEHLLQALGIGHQTPGESGVGRNFEGQLAVFRFVPEGSCDHLQQVGEEDLLGLYRHSSRLDLRQVENVADEVQQIRSRAVNGARELDLLRSQVVIRVLAELLSENQNGVQRGSQLVRRVRQELRLVLGSECQLFGLLFHRTAGLLDFLVFAFHFDVLLGELLRFLG